MKFWNTQNQSAVSESKSVTAGGWGKWWGRAIKVHEASCWCDGSVRCLDSDDDHVDIKSGNRTDNTV